MSYDSLPLRASGDPLELLAIEVRKATGKEVTVDEIKRLLGDNRFDRISTLAHAAHHQIVAQQKAEYEAMWKKIHDADGSAPLGVIAPALRDLERRVKEIETGRWRTERGT